MGSSLRRRRTQMRLGSEKSCQFRIFTSFCTVLNNCGAAAAELRSHEYGRNPRRVIDLGPGVSMSHILKKLQEDLKTSLKGGKKERTSALRFLISQLQYARIEKQADLEDEDVLRVLSKQAKSRRESMEAFEKAGRLELYDKEKRELGVIEEYMPEQLGEEEIRKVLRSLIVDEGLEGITDLGSLMKDAMPRLQGRAEGSLVSQLAKEELQRVSD